jgi:hypothetical protein
VNEVTTIAGAALVYTVLAMWATQPSYSCVSVEEPGRQLNLQREVDREHLARDARRIQQVAWRYAVHLASTPSVDDDYRRCHAMLARQLATVHDVPIEDVSRQSSVVRQ